MKINYPGSPEALAGGPEFRLDQLEAIYRITREVTDPDRSGSVLVGAGMGSGKAQPLDSMVLTPTGFIRMGDVAIGTEVVTPDGDTAPVSGVFPQGERPVYRVTLVDGRTVLADEDHLWTVLDRNRRRGGNRVMTTGEMVSGNVISANGNARFEIETVEPVDLGTWGSTLDPWLIGALLGNGGLTNSVMFSTGDDDTRDRVAGLLPAGVELKFRGSYDYQISAGRLGGHERNSVLNELRRLGLMGHNAWQKFVPKELMTSSVENRLALVQGLLDTDGHAQSDISGFDYMSASPQLAEDFVWLVRSLGGRATLSVKTVDGKDYQRVYGRLPERFAPFRCERKLASRQPATKYALKGLAVRSIEYVGKMPTQCIMVDHASHEYVTDGFTRTHNTVVSVEVIDKTKLNRVLIVGVRDAYSQWAKTMKEQGTGRKLLRVNGSAPGRENFKKLLDGEGGVFYVGLEFLRSQDWEKVTRTYYISKETTDHFGFPPDTEGQTRTHVEQKHIYRDMPAVDLIISDECHRHANQKSAAIKTLSEIDAKAKVGLSGTFFGNKFINAWSLTTWLWGKKIIGGKGKFEVNHCIKVPVMSKDGKTQIKTPGGFPLSKIIGERHAGEFVETLPCYVFIETPIGPVPEPEIVKVGMHPEQERQYREMESRSLTWIPTEITQVRAPLIADLDITQRIRLRTAALGSMTLVPGKTDEDSDSVTFDKHSKSKTLNEAYNVLHRDDWVGKKALILTHSKPFAIEAARRISKKYSVALKTGDTSSAKWDEEKARFMLPVSETESIQYMVAVISAVGTATDGLQANCAKVLWLSEDENNVNNIQGDNRIWRSGVDLEEYAAVKIVQKGTIAEGILSKNDTHRDGLLDSVAGLK